MQSGSWGILSFTNGINELDITQDSNFNLVLENMHHYSHDNEEAAIVINV